MKNPALLFLLSLLLFSCSKEKADLLLYNGVVYTVDETFSVTEAIAVKDGKILATGPTKDLRAKYEYKETIDLEGKPVYPGLIDAHCHFYGYATTLLDVNLKGTNSFFEMIERVKEFSELKKEGWITGRGWDQTDWPTKEFPDKAILDSLFPDRPVFLRRIDGHAALANQAALDLAGINNLTISEGGTIEMKNGHLTGILIDNPMDLVKNIIPKPSREELISALLEAQKNCFDLGLTSISDAGLDKDVVLLLDSLQKENLLKLRIYAMLSPTQENFDYFLPNGVYKTDRMNVRSFKIYADGALGSYGAKLLQPYCDKKDKSGSLIHNPEYFDEICRRIAPTQYQVNTHCIGDSANRLILMTYGKYLGGTNDRRWRIEHAQVVDTADFSLFGKYSVIPSVQPTHATSDMKWAEERLCNTRLPGAYAYRSLMNQNGTIALGTDFPVEEINPVYTFLSAVERVNQNQQPKGGYLTENALTRQEALRGMTIWAAFSNFEEKEKGSIEAGKLADFTVLSHDIMKMNLSQSSEVKVIHTFVGGGKVN